MTSVGEFWGQESTGSRFLLIHQFKKIFFHLTFPDFQMGYRKVPKSGFQSQKSSESLWKKNDHPGNKNIFWYWHFWVTLTFWITWPIFDDMFESQWKSNQRKIFSWPDFWAKELTSWPFSQVSYVTSIIPSNIQLLIVNIYFFYKIFSLD